ncbi:MAG: aminotransferase class I/II-fold pyridoxal phosphate-dependent enzyme, partial [Parcubacteria group bacterium]|nr:aminotransferase class I/II-fold pyridoxal phosphate-dependent enzyme [Parcubacteria group bacterium]
MKKIHNKIAQIELSKTIEIDTEAKRLKSSGQKIYNFSAGEPDLLPPEFVKQSLSQAYDRGKTKYGAVTGEQSLKEEICKKLKKDNNLSYKPENIAVTNGCKQALYNIFQCILNPLDEVIIYSPYWMSYTEQIKLAGGSARIIEVNDDFEPDLKKTKKAINSRTKAVVLNSPNNPTGAVYSKEKLQELAKIFKSKNIYVITDDVYERLVYGEKFYTIAQFMKDSLDKVIVVNSISKSYALPGLRLGYIAASKDVIDLVGRLQCQSTGNVCSIAQYVAED